MLSGTHYAPYYAGILGRSPLGTTGLQKFVDLFTRQVRNYVGDHTYRVGRHGVLIQKRRSMIRI